MVGAVAGVTSREGVTVRGAESVAVSFPGFYELLDSVTQR
jgi:5-enolpyruvylshikimate-3-phosphate synthase